MHGYVEREGLYQNCEIYNSQGSGFDPRAGPNLICSVYVSSISPLAGWLVVLYSGCLSSLGG
jgi:hypothetical protein